jgi:hypothetical protein
MACQAGNASIQQTIGRAAGNLPPIFRTTTALLS